MASYTRNISEEIILGETPTVTKERVIKKLYYSVGVSTADFKPAGVSVTVTPGDYTATFSSPVIGNVGVGDVIEYGGNFAYINEKVSTSIWKVVAANGDMPAAATTTAVTSIKRTFNSLASAVHGATPGVATTLGTGDLVTKDVSVLVACYDDGDDTENSIIQIHGFGLSSSKRLIIFTPTNTVTECNFNQRHNGTTAGGGYSFVPGVSAGSSTAAQQAAVGGIYIYNNAIDIVGLRITPDIVGYTLGPGGYFGVVLINTSGCSIANCFFRCREPLPVNFYINQHLYNYATASGGGNNFFLNNIISHDGLYDGSNGVAFDGILWLDHYAQTHPGGEPGGIIHNTVTGDFIQSAIEYVVHASGTATAFDPLYMPLTVNNAAKAVQAPLSPGTWRGDYAFSTGMSNTDGTTGSSSGGFIYNVSNDASAGTSNGNKQVASSNWNFISETSGSENFHLLNNSHLIGSGLGPDENLWLRGLFYTESVYPYWSQRYDIDLQERRGSENDIGADQVRQSFFEVVPLSEDRTNGLTRAVPECLSLEEEIIFGVNFIKKDELKLVENFSNIKGMNSLLGDNISLVENFFIDRSLMDVPFSDIVLLEEDFVKNLDALFDDLNYSGTIEDLMAYSGTIEEI